MTRRKQFQLKRGDGGEDGEDRPEAAAVPGKGGPTRNSRKKQKVPNDANKDGSDEAPAAKEDSKKAGEPGESVQCAEHGADGSSEEKEDKKKTSEEGQPSATGIAEPGGVGKAKAKAKASPKPRAKATAKAKSSAKAKAKATAKGKGKAKNRETKAKEKLEEHKRRRKHEKLEEGEEAEEAKESEGGTADAETGVAPKDGEISNGDDEAVVATPPAKKIPKKSEGKPGPDKPGQSDKPVPARRRRARNGEGEKTFARRRCPTTEMGAAKYHAIRNAFTDNIKPLLTHFSHHEDFSLEPLLSFGLSVSKNITESCKTYPFPKLPNNILPVQLSHSL